MNIVIIDDEKKAIDVLQIILKRIQTIPIDIKGSFTNVAEAYEGIENEQVDVVLLDIEMINTNGLNVAKQLLKKQPTIQIIFVTAHTHFAVEAFEVEATDYLLKPVDEKRLLKALTKVQNKLALLQKVASALTEKQLYAYTFGSFQLLDANQQIIKWRTKKVRELFLYLWLQNQMPVSNVVLIETLWPDVEYEKGLANLYTTIYQLRKLFKDLGLENPVELVNNYYRLKISMESDYEELKTLLAYETYSELQIQQLLNVYKEDFLEKEKYEWAGSIQQELRQKVVHTIEQYVLGRSNTLLKLNCLQKLMVMDEYNERYMFMYLTFLIEHNKKNECMQLYTEIKKKLERDLEIVIPKEISELYEAYMSTQILV